MNLEHFVSESLVQVGNAIKDAQKRTERSGAHINPVMARIPGATNVAYEHFGWSKNSDGAPVFLATFDVAVTAEQGTETKGEIGIMVASIGLGSQGQSTKQNAAVSPVQFKIPVQFPVRKSAP